MAFDFKKEFKEFYMPKNKPEIVTVPKANYIAVRGKQFSSILFYKCICTIAKAFCKMLHKFLQDSLYIQSTLCNKLALQLLPSIIRLTIDCILRNEKVIKPDFKNSI